jgi:hypothetical protein
VSQAQQIGEDLRYVRDAVTRRERSQHIPTPIAWIVAIYVAVGYTLLDVNPLLGGRFLAIGGLAMGGLFWVFGRRESRRSGEYDRAEVRKLTLHWASILLAIIGVVALGVARHIDGQAIGQFIALTIGLIYFLGGVHFDRNLLWLGPLLMGGAVAITYVPHYGWTALGTLVALGLVVPTWFRTRPVQGVTSAGSL